VLLSSTLWFAPPAAATDCEREIDRSARRHGVPAEVLHAVGQTETGRGDGLRPNALNIAGQSHYDLSPQQALKLFSQARRRGIKLIDIGCMQINHHYHKQHFSSVSEMLDPERNVDYAARFLKQLYEEERNWTMAVARYHAGKKNFKAQKRYVCAVIKKLVAAGVGAWTPAASRFCDEPQARCNGNGKVGLPDIRGVGEACASRAPVQLGSAATAHKKVHDERGWAATVTEARNTADDIVGKLRASSLP